LVYGSLGYISSGDNYKPRRSPQDELAPAENLNLPPLPGTGEVEPLSQLYSGGAQPSALKT
jgi:hypothetical protein